MNKKIYIIIILILLCIFIGVESKKFFRREEVIVEEEIKEEKICTYDNPIVPEGFKKVETTEASWELENGVPKGWNNGLVIEDEKGNQFVWVPVNLENAQYDEEDIKYNIVYNKEKMNYAYREYSQILRYGGFYIGRYEAGIPEDRIQQINEKEIRTTSNNKAGVPTSKKDQIVWNYISWVKANESAENMYKDNNFVESDLVSRKQWSSLVEWLKNSGYDVEDSGDWGNYSNVNFTFTGYYSLDGETYKYGKDIIKQTYNMLLSTGATERNKANNIYDLAGNIAEFIDYSETSENSMVKGGYYDIHSSCSVKNHIIIDGANNRQGFRVVLYLKNN